MSDVDPSPTPPPPRVYRHRLPTRIWHWVNAGTLLVLLMSGLTIFNAHPRLYWGEYGANFDRAWLVIGSTADEGYLRIGDWRVETTGVLGRWTDAAGEEKTWAFPGWATIPTSYSLADGRRWHLFFAWVMAIGLTLYMLWTAIGGHLKKDLHVRRTEWSPRHIWHDIKDHARLRFPRGEAAARYGILQKLSYIGVIFILLPLMIATGLTMSPGLNASAPWLLDLFGGRQSARSIHFIAAWALVAFFLVHILMVLLAGPVNEVRSMVTGWFRLPPEKDT
ncbi:MAG: cytochrome b/b6 domain-containing protein [Sphingopyxis sp.]|uniref:cytochrome b/b6 domain-containing protein n=1 Tax=Sphingopyxis sp. TaxID=1908224 RepID=UPI001A4242DF|nr:cytochrome b/b6 domain-containing protein [Sphingopyxis sp.]MBL9065243.1 cytochrome b/b6 domain-containing protein [Sphingopyxis sp.]